MVTKKKVAKKKVTKKKVVARKIEPGNTPSISEIGDQVLEKYRNQLNTVVSQHSSMIDSAREELKELIESSNQEMLELVQKLSADTAAEVEEEEPKPETAWVEDHLVLNPQAVALFTKMFEVMAEVLPDIGKLLKRR